MWLVAYSPLAGGRVAEDPVLEDIAAAYDATPAQVALAWLLAKERVVVIPCGRGEHVAENWAAQNLSLAEADLRRIDGLDRRERLVDYEFAPWNVTDYRGEDTQSG
jgi:diketogulonate reductase-like aldo/keto reductase